MCRILKERICSSGSKFFPLLRVDSFVLGAPVTEMPILNPVRCLPLKVWRLNYMHLNSLTTKKQTTKFSSAMKNVKSKLYIIENSKIRGQTM